MSVSSSGELMTHSSSLGGQGTKELKCEARTSLRVTLGSDCLGMERTIISQFAEGELQIDCQDAGSTVYLVCAERHGVLSHTLTAVFVKIQGHKRIQVQLTVVMRVVTSVGSLVLSQLFLRHLLSASTLAVSRVRMLTR